MSPDEELERLKAALSSVRGFLEKGDVAAAIDRLDAKVMFGDVKPDEAVRAEGFDFSRMFYESCRARGIERAAYIAFVPDEENEGHFSAIIGGEQTLGRMLGQFVSLYFGKEVE